MSQVLSIDESKILDFSEPVTFPVLDNGVDEGEEGVFWNVEDYPFPANSTPDEIYGKIESCLKEMGFESSRMTIWAYVDEKNVTWGGDFLHKKSWASRIYFIPGGNDKTSRLNRMFIDILLWQLDIPPPASLMVVSNGVRGDNEFFGSLRFLDSVSYSVNVIARPTRPVVPESAEWPRSLLEYAYGFDQSSDEPSSPREHKKFKGVEPDYTWGLKVRPSRLD